MDYAIRKWDKKAKKSWVLHILDPHTKQLETSLRNVKDADKGKVTQFVSYFKGGNIQSSGYYGISRDDADEFIKKVYEIKDNTSLKPFKELI